MFGNSVPVCITGKSQDYQMRYFEGQQAHVYATLPKGNARIQQAVDTFKKENQPTYRVAKRYIDGATGKPFGCIMEQKTGVIKDIIKFLRRIR